MTVGLFRPKAASGTAAALGGAGGAAGGEDPHQPVDKVVQPQAMNISGASRQPPNKYPCGLGIGVLLKALGVNATKPDLVPADAGEINRLNDISLGNQLDARLVDLAVTRNGHTRGLGRHAHASSRNDSANGMLPLAPVTDVHGPILFVETGWPRVRWAGTGQKPRARMASPK